MLRRHPNRTLATEHLADLRASGLRGETIRRMRCYTERDPQPLSQMLGRTYSSQLGPALVLSYWNIAGERLAYRRVKPLHPRKDRGKPVKYEAPSGGGNHLYFLPEDIDALIDVKAPLIVTEGEKKVAAAHQHGYLAVGTSGVFAWKQKGEELLLPDFDAIPLPGREVYVAFDSDAETNPHVRQGEVRLIDLLAEQGAIVGLVRIPQDREQKVGLDDFLMRDGPAGFDELLRLARREQRRGGFIVCNVANVESEEVEWLWPERLPKGKLVIMAGDPGVGKSFATLDIAARVSTGDPFPLNLKKRSPQSVILLTAEDDIADTVRPRLEAAGANVHRIHAIQSTVLDRGERGMVSLQRDLPKLEMEIARHSDLGLIIIDPISAYLGGIDSYKNAEVRGLLGPLSMLAQRYGVSVLAVTHLSKGDGRNASYRASGSMGFVAAARAAWLVGKCPDDPGRRLLLTMKNNLSEVTSGLAYRIEDGRVHWEQAVVKMTADELLARQADALDHERNSAIEEAIEWLRDALESEPVPQVEILEAAKAAGIKERTLRRAKERIGVVSDREGFGRGGRFVWSLPDSGPDEA